MATNRIIPTPAQLATINRIEQDATDALRAHGDSGYVVWLNWQGWGWCYNNDHLTAPLMAFGHGEYGLRALFDFRLHYLGDIADGIVDNLLGGHREPAA